jgi:hypothetical protein
MDNFLSHVLHLVCPRTIEHVQFVSSSYVHEGQSRPNSYNSSTGWPTIGRVRQHEQCQLPPSNKLPHLSHRQSGSKVAIAYLRDSGSMTVLSCLSILCFMFYRKPLEKKKANKRRKPCELCPLDVRRFPRSDLLYLQ